MAAPLRAEHAEPLRHAQVYAVSAYANFGTTAPSERRALRGDVRIGFSCEPAAGNAEALAELALTEVERLQARCCACRALPKPNPAEISFHDWRVLKPPCAAGRGPLQ